MSSYKKFWLIISTLVILAMVLAACAPQATPAPTQPPAAPTEPPAAATEPPAISAPEIAGPPGGFLEKALAGEYSGTTITVDGTQTDPDDRLMAEGWKAFEDATGIDVQYIGDKEFEARISIAIDAGQAPDVVDFPQPALLGRFVQQGHVVDVNSFISEDWLKQQYNPAWLDMATMPGPDGPMSAGVFNRYSVKSLVWYPKDDFEAAGYEVPTTWDELVALDGPDRGRWGCTLVHRHRVAGGHRLARHRLDGRCDAAHHLARELRRLGGRHAALLLARGEECG